MSKSTQTTNARSAATAGRVSKTKSRFEFICNEFRRLMLAAVADCIGDRNMPLLLSGGVDSATILAAQLALELPPKKLYTFQLGTRPSNDVRVSKNMTERFHLKPNHKIVRIKQNEDQLVSDVREVIELTGSTRKTHIQCGQAFLHLARAVRADGFKVALMGMAAGDLWGDSRKAKVAWHQGGEKAFSQHRRDDFNDENASDYSCLKVADSLGLKICDPYRYTPLAEFMFSLKWRELHTPKLKYLALYAFPEFWTAGKFYRTNSNLQIESGIRAWHDTLLSSALNIRDAQSVVSIYNDMRDGLV